MESLGVEAVYIDHVSGKNMNRPELQRMLHYVRKGDTVIVESISRFARNTQDCLAYSRKLKNLGIGIIFETQRIY